MKNWITKNKARGGFILALTFAAMGIGLHIATLSAGLIMFGVYVALVTLIIEDYN